MCPLWPAHYLLLYILVLGPLWLLSFQMIGAAAQTMSDWDITFEPENIEKLLVGDTQIVDLRFNKTDLIDNGRIIQIEYVIDDTHIADVFPERREVNPVESDGVTSFNVTGNFLGYTKICANIIDEESDSRLSKCIDISVIRKSGAIDKVFTYSVAALVAIIYINMGAALDTRTVKETVRRPIGPAIGFFSQFVIMPLLSFGVAKLLIPVAALQLGLFITGCSPGGGASNIWTLTLGGNLDLSITMTTISTISAFAMMPLWILTLGSTIFNEAHLTIPYSKIITFAVSLVVPLLIGVLVQYKFPKVAKFLVRILKPFAAFLIVFIVIFAIYTNLYLFELFTWQILLSGMLVPWLGYLLGGGTAMLFNQSWRDILAIAIETGVQNTGLAIFALRFSLDQPEADLTTALPVAVAIMTPVIPTLILIIQKCSGKCVPEPPDAKKDTLFQGIGTSNGPHHGGGYLLKY